MERKRVFKTNIISCADSGRAPYFYKPISQYHELEREKIITKLPEIFNKIDSLLDNPTTEKLVRLANSINPTIIVVGLIMLIPIINRFSTFKLIVTGMTISAFSLLIMSMPIQWMLSIPGIHNMTQAYMFVICAQIIVFAIGELIFSPRFTEYISVVAPKDKVASYMGLSALPMFIAKPINGFMSGILVAGFSYEGIRAKIDSGNIAYKQSPEFMWMIYFILALLSPIAVLAMKGLLTSGREKKKHEVHGVPESPSNEPD